MVYYSVCQCVWKSQPTQNKLPIWVVCYSRILTRWSNFIIFIFILICLLSAIRTIDYRLSWRSSSEDSALPLQGVCVQLLVREIRSYKPHKRAKRKKKRLKWSKNWCFQTVVLEKTLESPLNCKEIKPVNRKGNQSWIFIGRTDAEAPILWPPDVKSQLTGKDPDAGKDWGHEKEVAEDGMVGWHHQFNGHEFEQTPGDGEGQASLACFSPWDCKELDTTEQLNNKHEGGKLKQGNSKLQNRKSLFYEHWELYPTASLSKKWMYQYIFPKRRMSK